MSYWMDFPSQIVSSLLGLGDEFIAEEGVIPDDIPAEMHEAFVDYLIDHAGDAEYQARLFLDYTRTAAKKWLDGFLRKNRIDPQDHEYKLWYQNIPDEMAHEEAFGLIGGMPEYNELDLNYIPAMLQDTGVQADERAVQDELIRAVQTVDETPVQEAVRELWDEAKENVRDESDPRYWKEADWIEAMSQNGCIVVRTVDDTYDVYVEGQFFDSHDTEAEAMQTVAWMQEVGWHQMGKTSFVMDVFVYDEVTREVEEQSTGETAVVNWRPKPLAPDPRQTTLPLESHAPARAR